MNESRRSGRLGAGRILSRLPLAAACAAWSIASPAAEVTLYERIALGPLVVHGRCALGGRRAAIDVKQVIKGAYPEKRLWVTFRSENYNRAPGTPKIEFTLGGESILVLEPEKNDDDEIKASDRFVLVGGAKGKIDLPAEGADALLGAVHRFAAIQALENQNEIWNAQRTLIRDENPILVRAGFEEILKFRLGNEELVVTLLERLTGPRPEFRVLALKVIGQIFASGRRAGNPIASTPLLVAETLARANGDEDPEVRAESVRALRQAARADLTEPLAWLAAKDPSQMVRYEAELALLDLRAHRPAPGAGPSR